MKCIGYDYRKCTRPETMSKDELLARTMQVINDCVRKGLK